MPPESSHHGRVIQQKLKCAGPKYEKPITVYWYKPNQLNHQNHRKSQTRPSQKNKYVQPLNDTTEN